MRQNRRNQGLEQFLREQKRKGNLRLIQEENLQKGFIQHQDAEEKRIKEEENQQRLILDEALAKQSQAEEKLELHKFK